MSLVRWNPFRELEDMSNRLNTMMGRSMVGTAGTQTMTAMPDWNPSVDIVETSEEYLIKAELPEVKKEDVKLTCADGVLSLSGERKQEKEEKGRRFHRVERSYGSFTRAFALPENVDAAKIRAEFNNGMLTVHLTKTAVTAPKSTEIKIA